MRDCLTAGPVAVLLSEPDWREQVVERLVSENAVSLQTTAEELADLRAAILELMAQPVDVGMLLLHPRVRSIQRQNGNVKVIFELAEGVQ